MKLNQAYYSRGFKKKLTKFSTLHKQRYSTQFNLFWENPFEPSLKTHKLTGKLQDYWSFSLDYHVRVLFRFVDKGTVELIDIGGHEIYK